MVSKVSAGMKETEQARWSMAFFRVLAFAAAIFELTLLCVTISSAYPAGGSANSTDPTRAVALLTAFVLALSGMGSLTSADAIPADQKTPVARKLRMISVLLLTLVLVLSFVGLILLICSPELVSEIDGIFVLLLLFFPFLPRLVFYGVIFLQTLELAEAAARPDNGIKDFIGPMLAHMNRGRFH